MKALSQLVELFEKDSSFWKEWREDAVLAVSKRGYLLDDGQRLQLRKIILDLREKKHLSKQPSLFGM